VAKLLKFWVLLFLTILISACGGGGGNASAPSSTGTTTTTALYSTAPDALAMSVGSAQEFTIGGGTAPYSAVSNDVDVAVTAVSSSKLSIGGVAVGDAKIQIRDSIGALLSVPVTVKSASKRALYSTSPSSITVAAGSLGAQTYRVAGGVGPYSATSTNVGVVSVVINGDSITVTGMSVGSAGVVVMDNVGALLNIAVSVPAVAKLDLFTTAPLAITVSKESTMSYSVGGGTAPYSATSSSTSVATVLVAGSGLTVNGLANGSASVVVRDSAGATVTIAVTVPTPSTIALYTTAPTGVTVAIGASPAYSIGGGTLPYSATSSNTSVATVSVTGSSLTVNGLSAGSASVVVRDNAGATVPIAVTVPNTTTVPLYTTAPSSVTVASASTTAYTVGGGTSPYTAVTDDTSIASVSLSGGSLAVTGVALGKANIRIRDSAGSILTLSVSVATPTLMVTPNTATAIIKDALLATITGGKAPYTVVVGNTLVATASISNNQLSVTPLQVGQTIITVIDSLNQSVVYSLTANAATPGIRLSPSTLTISERSTDSFQLKVYGATGSANVFSSNLILLSASILDDVVTIVTGSNGNRCVEKDTPIAITVLDSTRAIGTATITIQENSPACTSSLALYTTAPPSVTLTVGSTGTYSIGGGTASYMVISSNTSVATVLLSGSNFIVTGINAGIANIFITDSLGTSLTIAVTVP